MDSISNIVLYFVMAICIIVFSVMAVTSRKILRAATYLLFVLISTAVVYFQLGYEFLGGVQIAVYAGGIMVLFVFCILLTHRPDEKSKPLASHKRIMGVLVAVAGTIVLVFALFYMPLFNGASLTQQLAASEPITMDMIGRAFNHIHGDWL